MHDNEARQIAAQAWEFAKDLADPSFAQCAPDHQARLVYKVQSVESTGRVEDAFDEAVQTILSTPPTLPPVVAGAVVEDVAPPPVGEEAGTAETAPPPKSAKAKQSKPEPKE